MGRILHEENKVKRHCKTVRWVHWLVALSTFALIFSGFGQMPMYQRYGITKIPGLGWSNNYSLTLNIHYIAGLILVFSVVYHMVYHGIRRDTAIIPRKGDFKESLQIIKAMFGFGEEPPSDKFLAEQRLAYAFIGGNLILVVFTGLVKVFKNSATIPFSEASMALNSNLHNLAAMMILLGIFLHLVAFAFGENRKLIWSIFHGKVDLHYVQERHCHWYDKMVKKQSSNSSL